MRGFPRLMNEGRFPQVGDSIFLSSKTLLAGNSLLGPVHMIPGQLIALGQLTDPGLNFASVHGLTLVTVQMNFSLARGNFERRVTRFTTPIYPLYDTGLPVVRHRVTRLAEVTFLDVNRMQKLPRGKSSLVHSHY